MRPVCDLDIKDAFDLALFAHAAARSLPIALQSQQGQSHSFIAHLALALLAGLTCLRLGNIGLARKSNMSVLFGLQASKNVIRDRRHGCGMEGLQWRYGCAGPQLPPVWRPGGSSRCAVAIDVHRHSRLTRLECHVWGRTGDQDVDKSVNKVMDGTALYYMDVWDAESTIKE
jgi:hypothetical protein